MFDRGGNNPSILVFLIQVFFETKFFLSKDCRFPVTFSRALSTNLLAPLSSPDFFPSNVGSKMVFPNIGQARLMETEGKS